MEPPLCHAAAEGDVATVSQLLASRARVDERNTEAETALWLASRAGHAEVAAVLLRAGATMDAINLLGQTPLYGACEQAHVEVVLLLLAHQATIDYPANEGLTPLMAAAKAGSMDIVIALMEKGAKPGATAEDGSTAGELAEAMGHTVLAKYLDFHDVQFTRSFSSLTPHTKSSATITANHHTSSSDSVNVVSPRTMDSQFSPRRRPADSPAIMPLEEMLQCICKSALQCPPDTLRDEHFSPQDAVNLTVKLQDGSELRMKEFLPKVHATIRSLCGVDGTAYAAAWDLPEEKLTLTLGAGRSGSLFARSNDDRFLLKTIPHDEAVAYLDRAHAYYKHLRAQPDCLIMRILGLYRFHCSHGTFNLLISGNLLHCNSRGLACGLPTPVIFDLKGRVPKKGKLFQRRGQVGCVWKDKDLDRFFWLADGPRARFLAQLHADIDWLQTHNMMDYSLLVGVREPPPHPDRGAWLAALQAAEAAEDNAGSAFRRHLGGVRSLDNEVYYIGIIDCLTTYNGKKVVANLCKSILWKGTQLSTVPSETYAARFYTFMEAVFPAEQRARDPALATSHPNAPYALRDGFNLTEVFEPHALRPALSPTRR